MSKQEMTEKEKIKEALNHMAEALCFAYETKSDQGNAFAWMLDSVIKYGTVIVNEGNVLSASADYTDYENNLPRKKDKE